MAAADYDGIRDAIAAKIRAAVSVPVVVEQVPMYERGSKVYVFLSDRRAPEGRQALCAGRKTRFLVTYSIWVYAYGYKIADACSARDALVADVELALLGDITFGRSDVFMSWQEGGEIDHARQDKGFNVGAEIRLIVDVTAEVVEAVAEEGIEYFGDRYFGPRYYGNTYFAFEAGVPTDPSQFMGNRYFGARYFGPRYFA